MVETPIDACVDKVSFTATTIKALLLPHSTKGIHK